MTFYITECVVSSGKFLIGAAGESEGGGAAFRDGEFVFYFPASALPTTADSAIGSVIPAFRPRHLAGRIGLRPEEEVLESGRGGIPVDAQRAGYEPLAHGPEGVVVERIHGVVPTEAPFFRVGIQTLPDRGRALGDRVQPTGISRLLEQPVGDVAAPVVAQRLADPGGGDEACHQ